MSRDGAHRTTWAAVVRGKKCSAQVATWAAVVRAKKCSAQVATWAAVVRGKKWSAQAATRAAVGRVEKCSAQVATWAAVVRGKKCSAQVATWAAVVRGKTMKLGIVTISFNQAAFLEEAIESVQMADPARLRYVMVDPGSTDASREIIERHRERFSRVILEPDRGPADGLNKGFAACNADVYGYLNSDDRFVPGALDFALDYFEKHPDIDILFGGIRIVDEKGRAKLRGRAPDKLDLRKLAYGAYHTWQQSTFFRRSIYEQTNGFNIGNRVTWDGELVVDMALAGARLGYVNKALGDFRIYPGSITGSQRLAKVLFENAERIRGKILAAGYPPMSPMRAKFEQLKYKFSPVRHLRSTFGLRTV